MDEHFDPGLPGELRAAVELLAVDDDDQPGADPVYRVLESLIGSVAEGLRRSGAFSPEEIAEIMRYRTD